MKNEQFFKPPAGHKWPQKVAFFGKVKEKDPVTELGGGREVMPSQIKLRNTAGIAMEW